MKALLMKDFYTLWRQLRVYLLVMLVISVFNGAYGNIFITIWAALLPCCPTPPWPMTSGASGTRWPP